MSGRHLTSTYRPQTFAQVLGQDAVKAILSKAAVQGDIAPAYMFSGTRGVGKTTIARILAKAINCAQAPTMEPCNKCHSCLQITRGVSLDVREIDGASHTGVDNIRKINEEISFSPIECRYKVIIIDEAHMLSKSAFNALLKTLEEPPGHAVFILATTEPHRFPATIVSRCQHFVFQRIPQKELEGYLAWILDQENAAYEPAALSLLAKKGGGSVRDSLSLLSQILALGEGVQLETVQRVFGLAGQEILDQLFAAMWARDSAQLLHLVQELLDQGLDLAFFLQDLSQAWRNMFIIQQVGYKQAVGLLDMSEAEVGLWAAWAEKLSLPHVHAGWQLTLEAQKNILTNPDPGLALELLLFNLAFLPDLLPLSDLSGSCGVPAHEFFAQDNVSHKRSEPVEQGPTAAAGDMSSPLAVKRDADNREEEPYLRQAVDVQPDDTPHQLEDTACAATDVPLRSSVDWPGFLRFIRKKKLSLPNLATVQVQVDDEHKEIVLTCLPYVASRLTRVSDTLKQAVEEYFGPGFTVNIKGQGAPQKKMTKKDLLAQVKDHPVVQEMLRTFQARVVDVSHLSEDG